MVMFIGQVERGHSDREAFQEIEYRRFLEPLCKWVVQIDHPARIPELVSQAFHRACSGRPGPVAVALPEDMLLERTTVEDAGRYTAVSPGVASDALPALRALLAGARRPLVVVGGGAGPRGRARISAGSSRRTRSPPRRRSAARTAWTTPIRATPATSGSESIRSSPSGCAKPTCCWRSAPGWAR